VCLAVSTIVTVAPATTLQHLDTRELTLDSQDVVIGEVASLRPHWNAQHTKIFTDVTVHVTEALKGGGSESIVLTQLGGEVDGVRVDVPGAPIFRVGQPSLFFIWRDPAGHAQVNGMAQGKFDIAADASTGVRTVQRSVTGFAVRDVKTLRPLAVGQVAPSLELEALVNEVRRTLAEER